MRVRALRAVVIGLLGVLALGAEAAEKELVLIAGKPSHPPGMHEFRAGCLLLQKCLEGVSGLRVTVYTNGWPGSDAALDLAAAIVMYADGGGGHPAILPDRLTKLRSLVDRGVGLGMMHYACEVPKDKGGVEFLDWIGGYYEHEYSCNPIWTADFTRFPDHPITRGLSPFSIKDEWYFNMRWRPEMKGLTPILVARPSDQVRDGPYVYPRGPYAHIQASKGRDETMMWAADNGSRGRAFGFTGGHFHDNWSNDQFRKVALNAMLWLCRMDVPQGGVSSGVTPDEMAKNLDPKKR